MITKTIEYTCPKCLMTMPIKSIKLHKGSNECMMEKMDRELESEMWWHQG